MTFLEHVIRKYIGPPRGGYWKCPYCDRRNPSVLVNAPKAGCKVKWRCVAAGCPVSGKPRDEYDLLRIYHPDTRYPEQRAMVADLRAEWEAAEEAAGCGESGTHDAAEDCPSSPRGHSRQYDRDIAQAWAGLYEDVRRLGIDPDEAYEVLWRLYDRGYFRHAGWHMRRVLGYWQAFLEWVEETNASHRAACRADECDWWCCRAARGLPPLTREEIAAQRAEAEAQRAADRAEFERGVDELASKLRAIYHPRTGGASKSHNTT